MRKNYTNFNKPTDDISVVIQPFLVTIKNLILRGATNETQILYFAR